VAQLLDALDIAVPAAERRNEATRLLRYLVGEPALARYQRLERWLAEVRTRSAVPQPLALDEGLRWVAPELFQQEQGRYRYRLSFRLFALCRLRLYGEKRGWSPRGGTHRTLAAALAALGKDRLGDMLRGSLEGIREAYLARERPQLSPSNALALL